MPDPRTIERLRGLVFSAVELREQHPDWKDSFVEDYLSLIENFALIADLLDIEIDQKIEEISTDFSDGSIPFADGGFLVEENSKLFWDSVNSILRITGRISSTGRIKGTTRINATPYNVLSTDENIYVDTNSEPITLNLPPGSDGVSYRIVNVGKNRNDVTLTPDGTDLLFGVNNTEKVIDSEVLIMTFEETEGWY
jgi:hypothetical protein